MGYNQDALANFFFSMRGRLLEFIHRTNTRDYAVTRGRDRGSFNNQLMNEHKNHIHVAMDNGGWLLPGLNPPIYNGLGKPEAVLTPQQSTALVQLARRSQDDGLAGNTYNFEFRETTLTPSKLRAIQDADAAYARTGRAR